MPISPATTRIFHRTLYANMLQTVTILKRDNDQQQGTVRAVTVANCRQSMVFKDREPIQGDMTANHRCVWHLSKIDLDAAGINFINAADRIVNLNPPFGVGGYWQPESTTEVIVKLFGNHVCVSCLRVDPPST